MTTNKYLNEKDTSLIEKMAKLDDKSLVDKLWAEDSDAWKYIYLRSVLPVLKRPQIFSILNDRNLNTIDIYGMLYERMLAKKRLSVYKFKCPVIYWMRTYVLGEVYRYLKKNKPPVSQDDLEKALKTIPTSEINIEDLELARESFNKLWKENPMRAYVHLLKVRNEMSAKDIKDVLGVSSETNVNKIFERALNDIRNFRNELLERGSK